MNAKWYGMAPLMIGIFTAMSPAAAQKTAETEIRGQIVAPGNTAPERDSRGNLVISSAAVAPEGSNPAVGVISPIRDPKVVFAPRASTRIYRRCSKTVTDGCTQFWEPPRNLPNCPGDPECPG
jgi:hypothetical protein